VKLTDLMERIALSGWGGEGGSLRVGLLLEDVGTGMAPIRDGAKLSGC
jgi:hypothetical protein